MSFKAILKIDQRSVNVLYCEYEFRQQLNKDAYPTTLPQAGLITVFLESTRDTFFEDWVVSPTQKKSCSIVFFKRDNMSRMKELFLTDAYCVSFKEKFNAKGSFPMYIEIKLSAGEIRYGSSVYRNPWFESEGRSVDDSTGSKEPVFFNEKRESVSENKDFRSKEEVSVSSQGSEPAKEIEEVKAESEEVRGVTYEEFVNSVTDFKDGANADLARQSFNLWKEENWEGLEELFVKNNLNKWKENIYPPNNGAINVSKITLDPRDFNNNLIIDRYGNPSGKFISLSGTPFGARALPGSLKNDVPKKYKVVKPIKNVQEGKIIPWFGQVGLGKQYKLEKSLDKYLEQKLIIEIE